MGLISKFYLENQELSMASLKFGADFPSSSTSGADYHFPVTKKNHRPLFLIITGQFSNPFLPL